MFSAFSSAHFVRFFKPILTLSSDCGITTRTSPDDIIAPNFPMSIEDLDDPQTFKLFVINLSWLNKRDLKWPGVEFVWRNLLRQRSNDWTAEDGASEERG